MRTARTMCVAVAVGATAGGGVIFALVDPSAENHAPLPEGAFVRLTPAVYPSVSTAHTPQLVLTAVAESRPQNVLGTSSSSASSTPNANLSSQSIAIASSGQVERATDDGVRLSLRTQTGLISAGKSGQSIRTSQLLQHKRRRIALDTVPHGVQGLFAQIVAVIARGEPAQRARLSRTSHARRKSGSAA
jgi:hypothetical protein